MSSNTEAKKRYFKTSKGKQKLCEAMRRYHIKAKTKVIKHYSGGKSACVRCGESDINCLTIDHIEAIGSKGRINAGYSYLWLIKNNYPQGYQTLCMNCQWRKRAEQREYRGNNKEKKNPPITPL